MRLGIIFFVFYLTIGELSAQNNGTKVSQRTSSPTNVTLNLVSTQKGKLPAVQSSSFVALPATKQTTPPVAPVLVFSSGVANLPDSSLLETTPTSKSLRIPFKM
jgi:hypothetical protein